MALHLLLVVIALLLVWLLLSPKEKLMGMPGPRSWPLVGVLPQMGIAVNHKLISFWARKYGSVYKFQLLHKEIVVVTGTQALREALMKEELGGRVKTFRNWYLSQNYSDLVLTSSCPHVTWMRDLAKQGIMEHLGGEERLEQITMDIVSQLMSELKQHSDSGEPFDPMPLMSDTVLKITYMVLFHEPLTFDDPDFAPLKELNQAVTESLGQTHDGALLDLIPCIRFIYNRTFSKCKKALRTYTKLYESWEDRCKNEAGVGGITRRLISMVREDNHLTITHKHAATFLMNLTIAGHTKPYSLLSSLLNILVHYPQVQEQVQEEVECVLGDSREVRMEDELSMPYTQATVLELLRYAHPVPLGMPRRTLGDITLCGYHIPKDTQMLLNYWGQHHTDTLWQDPYIFQPERFLDDSGNLLTKEHPHRQNLLPFGIGERSCVCARLSLQHLFLVTAAIMQRFTLLPANPTTLTQPSCHPKDMEMGVVMMPTPYTLRVQERKRREGSVMMGEDGEETDGL